MITIEVIGMNHYMLMDYSKMHTKQIANLFETSEDEIFFHSGDLRLFHAGVDQTSWHVLMRVYAPHKYHPFEANVAKYLIESMLDYILNAHVQFVYVDEGHYYEKLNNDYPAFFPDEPHDEDDYDENEDEENIDDDEDFSDEELFEGNAFAGFEEKMKQKANEEKMCECGHQHVCCNGKSAGCGKVCVCGERCLTTKHHDEHHNNHDHDHHECCHCHDHHKN